MARASTRSSARQAESSQKSSQDQSSPKRAGTKRKASVSASPAGKGAKKAQKTLEQTLPGENERDDSEKVNKQSQEDKDVEKAKEQSLQDDDVEKAKKQSLEDGNGNPEEKAEKPPQQSQNKDAEMSEDIQDADMKDAVDGTDAEAATGETDGEIQKKEEEKADVDMDAEMQAKDQKEADADGKAENNGQQDEQAAEDPKGESNSADAKKEQSSEQPATSATNGDGAVESSQSRGDAMPSNVLEKGIIYFLTRPRVGMDDPNSVQDIARSYIVLRPLPKDAKLTDGAINEMKNARLLAVPKKVLPRSHRDVFMSFVEKAGATMDQLKEEFFQGSSYSTQTVGVRTQPPIAPIGEGIYAITSTQRASHLAYMLTIPKEMGAVQEDMGLAVQGSFALSLKNPTQAGPANTNLGTDPGFSNEIMEEFRGRGWMPVKPEHLEYSSAQFLLIGESHGELGGAVEAEEKDKKDDKTETPHEEMEKLEGEDEQRVEGLKGDDTIFEDLGVSSKDYSLLTTW